ncbi:CPBP family intramembrane glutamic endopeptidase [Planobispora takensis]|uniref:CAAX prenyl protease 2/Lysostaphin resistance protein A-like domain-containing protein n=1 Tax=Planobispora takensis TaxID=1367882 RepID=A0A8J3WXQ4_9ACTN|nr:CPBP family intramembrane glutamic endopeptidase [Planobispora takensis]GII05500.1 hypothetical protein Pta02_75080 [Planobispora takensis]
MRNRSWWADPWRTHAIGRSLGWGLAAGFTLPTAVIMVLYATGAIDLTRSTASATSVAATALTAAVLTPVIEETLARYLLRLIEHLAGTWTALGVTAVLFGAGHVAMAAANDTLPDALLYALPARRPVSCSPAPTSSPEQCGCRLRCTPAGTWRPTHCSARTSSAPTG